MRKLLLVIVCLCLIPVYATGDESREDYRTHWPQWRGPDANGVAPYGGPPVEWAETKNIKWKTEIPGKGHATPIVWGNRIYVLTAVETDRQTKSAEEEQTQPRRRRGPPVVQTSYVHEFVIFAIDRSNGEIIWQHTAAEEAPHEGTHPTGTWASSSPVTDGEHVYAYFGSRGLYCYDMQGNQRWEKDFGDMSIRMSFGEGSSPVLYDDRVVVNWDHEGQSFIIALDKKTGKELWRVARDERTSWSTPLIVEDNGQPQVITSATHRIRSYDFATGQMLWE
ncbi:MAG: PQQ-binding-like beta-propeller repeat protein, partial [Dehalococcoidia bacterium]|nr:PQQ-binding-like beta-propeller repeat protein [Dehalococcoidia bacterium]